MMNNNRQPGPRNTLMLLGLIVLLALTMAVFEFIGLAGSASQLHSGR